MQATWPITEIVVNSVVAEPIDGVAAAGGRGFTIKAWRGIAATASGRWRSLWMAGRAGNRPALGKDLGRYAFRAFSLHTGKIDAWQLRDFVARHQQRG